MKKRFSVKRMALLGALTALSLIVFMIESLFPPLFLPGAKMGLSNIFSLLALLMLGPVEALVLVLVRTFLGSLFVGNLSVLMYSMPAGVVAILLSALFVRIFREKVSILAVSVCAAVLHNITQNLIYCAVARTPEMLLYLPWLALIGVLAGVIVGAAVMLILKTVPTRVFARVLEVEEVSADG